MAEITEQQIRKAAETFETLLREQLARQERLLGEEPEIGFADKKQITIGLIDGDGIGPIIMKEATRILTELLMDEILSGRVMLKQIQGLNIENRLKLGQSVPEEVMLQIKACDVLLKGPTTTPKGGSMESANVTLRRELDLFANVRPVTGPDLGIDWIFFRENTEGEYTLGSKGIALNDVLTMDFKVTTDVGTRRIMRAALEYARQNGKTELAIVTKANIMKKTDGMFSALCHEEAERYPEIHAEDWYVDIMAANLVNPAARTRFQVFVLPNLYGDILTDEAAQIQGGVGTAGSANIGTRYAMFEAIHGSAPRKIEAGEGDYANPASILNAEAMLLRHIAMPEKAEKLERALQSCLNDPTLNMTGHRGGSTCREFGDAVLRVVKGAD